MNQTDILSRVLQESTFSSIMLLGKHRTGHEDVLSSQVETSRAGHSQQDLLPQSLPFPPFFFLLKEKKVFQATYFYWSWLGLYPLFWGWSQRGLLSPVSSFSFFKKKRKPTNISLLITLDCIHYFGHKAKEVCYVVASLKEFVIWLRLVFSNTIPSFESLREHL